MIHPAKFLKRALAALVIVGIIPTASFTVNYNNLERNFENADKLFSAQVSPGLSYDAVSRYTELSAEANISDDTEVLNNTTGVAYETIEKAFEAADNGDELVLLNDVTAETLLLVKNITLDLNGKFITADNFAAFANVKFADSGETKGGIVIHKDNLVVSRALDDTMLLYKDDIGGGRAGYIAATLIQQYKASVKNNVFELVLRPSFDNSTQLNLDIFGNGAADNGLKVIVRVEDSITRTQIGKEYLFSDTHISKAYVGNAALKLTLSNISSYGENVNVKIVIESDTGIKNEVLVWTFL